MRLMKKMLKVLFCLLVIEITAQNTNMVSENGLPIIPIGMDSYRMWGQLHVQRIGARAYMRSTYDRLGGNETADAGHFLFADGGNHNVTLDIKGKGVFYFFRANHWHGSPWHFIVDGTDYVVKEMGTDDPLNAKKVFDKTTFIHEPIFPEPIAWTWSTTKGADLIWMPMPFEDSMRIAYSRTHYGTGYYIYHLYANEESLSQPIDSWQINEIPDKDVIELINRSGTDIAPKDIGKKTGMVKLDKPTIRFETLKKAPSVVRALKLFLPMDKALDLERARLKITWDGAEVPSVDAPLSLFFGTGTFHNREKKEFLVKGFPINVRYDYEQGQVELACYYPMPFFKSAEFEITGINIFDSAINYEIRYEPLEYEPRHSSYFHATYMDIPEPELGEDMVFLDTKGLEGHKGWSGNFVGTSFIFSHRGVLGTLEGDPRFFFDGSQTPQAYGTGSEEWGGGGDYWGGRNMTLPFAGHPVGVGGNNRKLAHDLDWIESAYRFLVADLMPFGDRAVIKFEHGAENLSTEHYEGVTYWYGLPSPSLIRTDEIDIGDLRSEEAHAYISKEASDVVEIESRYELGIDEFPSHPKHMSSKAINALPNYVEMIGTEVYPTSFKKGRFTRGSSEFNIKLNPENVGALLRRTLDYSFPNQTAEVYVREVAGENGRKSPQDTWQHAGTWYLAGSNTVLYSNPPGELNGRQLRTKTSNRRFRDDEFMIPAHLTKGKTFIRVKIQFVEDKQQLFPDFPFPKQSAWSELEYDVFSFIVPRFKMEK